MSIEQGGSPNVLDPATESKQNEIIENQTDGSQKTQIVDAGGDGVDVIDVDGSKGLVTISPGHVSTSNSTSDILLADAVYTGTWENITNFGILVITLKASHTSATDGLQIDFSSDGTNVDSSDNFTIAADTGKTFSFQAATKYFRVKYTNGGTNQTYFRLQTILKPYYVKPSSHRIDDPISGQDDAELVKAVITGENPGGTFINFQSTTAGNFKMSLEEFDDTFLDNPLPVRQLNLLVSMGLISGYSVVQKFGQNDNLNVSTYEDIWDGGGVYTYPADGTAPIVKLVGHNAADTEPIEVQGLDINGTLVIQTKTLTGLTAVTLDTPLWRVFRMKNVGTSDLVDDVCAINTGDTVDYACINNGNNQTLMALYTIPLGKTGYLYQGTNNLSDVARGVGASGRLWMRELGKVFQVKRTFGVHSDGSGFINVVNKFPSKIPAMTDIRVDALGSAAGVVINTTFEILLIDD